MAERSSQQAWPVVQLPRRGLDAVPRGLGMERPGTSFRSTETVAGFNPRCSASLFRSMRSFLAGGFFPKSRFFLSRPPHGCLARRNVPPRKHAFRERDISILLGLSITTHAITLLRPICRVHPNAKPQIYVKRRQIVSLLYVYEIHVNTRAKPKAPARAGYYH
jgi:hypothetical protein